jgi:hypothetical protein
MPEISWTKVRFPREQNLHIAQQAFLLLADIFHNRPIACRVRRGFEWSDRPTLLTVYTSYFLSRSHHCLNRRDSAWIYLREAMTVAELLELQWEETISAGTVLEENHAKRKLFWTLFITERYTNPPMSIYIERERQELLPVVGDD